MPKQEKTSFYERSLQNDKFQDIRDFLYRNLIFVYLGFLCFFLAFAFDATIVTNTSGATVLAFAMIMGYGCFLYSKKQLTTERLIALIFVAGFVLRLQYVLSTPISIRQHDVGSFGSGHGWEGSKGHAGYIEWFFFNKFSLIDKDPSTMAQFYQPPFHHFIASLWMHIFTHFGSCFGMTYARATASVQYLTLFYSSCCMIVAERIFRHLGLRKNGLILSCVLIAFHPTFILLSGSINNDILSILMIFLAIYTTICWYQHPSYFNIIGIAFSVGLGMMTKISVALIAPPIAMVFLIKFISDKGIRWDYIKQFFVFGVICVPLGMWYGIRNLTKYGVPLTYVPRGGVTSIQYIGNYTLFERLFDLSKHPFSNVFENWLSNNCYTEYNPFIAILKTSCFGEFDFSNYNSNITAFSWILLILNIGIIIVAISAMVYYLCKRNDFLSRTLKVFLGGYYILLMLNYFNFCFQYPHTCSMDFRYIVPTVLIGAIFIGIMMDSIENNIVKSLASRVINYGTSILSVLFMLFSSIVYIILGME